MAISQKFGSTAPSNFALDTERTLAETGSTSSLTVAHLYVLVLDLTNMTNGRALVAREYTKTASTGQTARVVNSYQFANDLGAAAWRSLPFETVHYSKITLEQTDGSTGLSIPWSIRQLD